MENGKITIAIRKSTLSLSQVENLKAFYPYCKETKAFYKIKVALTPQLSAYIKSGQASLIAAKRNAENSIYSQINR